MIKFDNEHTKKAVKLLELKDYSKAAKDVLEINESIKNTYELKGIQIAIALDTRLRKEYPIIQILLSVANLLPKSSLIDNVKNKPVQTLEEVEKLKQDLFGIYATVLLKAAIIKDVKEFIACVD